MHSVLSVAMPSYHDLKRAATKRFGKCRVRPQDKFPEILEFRTRLNSMPSFPYALHPKADEVCSWQIQDPMLSNLSCSHSESIVVDSDSKFDKMLEHLIVQSQIAFDTESNHDDSFHSMICVLQLSSASQNFVVDVFKLFSRIRKDLSSIFQSPRILKIVHDTNDIQLLQRDFEIFCQATINMQEVFHLHIPQPHPISYAKMIQQLFNVELDKLGQHADWRVRPIPKQLISYAIRDTHYLIRAWDKVKRELLSKGVTLKDVLPSASISSLLRVYQFPKRPSATSVFDKVRLSSKRLLLAEEQTSTMVFLKLYDIRLRIAKETDRPEKRVLGDDAMYDMLARKWTSFEDFSSAFKSYRFVKDYLPDMYVALDTEVHTTHEDDNVEMLELEDYDAMDLLPPSDPPAHIPMPQKTASAANLPSASSKQPVPTIPEFPNLDDLSDISDEELPSSDHSDYEIVVEEVEIDSADENSAASIPPTVPSARNAPFPKPRKHRSKAPQRPSDPLLSSIGQGKHSYRRWLRRKHVLARNDIRVGLGFQPVPFRFRHRKSRKSE